MATLSPEEAFAAPEQKPKPAEKPDQPKRQTLSVEDAFKPDTRPETPRAQPTQPKSAHSIYDPAPPQKPTQKPAQKPTTMSVEEAFSAPKEDDYSYLEAAGRNLKGGYSELASGLGTILEYGGERFNSDILSNTGESMKAYWNEVAEANPSSEAAQQSPYDDPKVLTDPKWWLENTSRMAPSFAVPLGVAGGGMKLAAKALPGLPKIASLLGAGVGGLFGGAIEGAQTYEEGLEMGHDEPTAARAGEAMALGTGVLNALPFYKIMNPAARGVVYNFITRGLAEGFTEMAEEPLDAMIQGMVYDKDVDWEEVARSAAHVGPVAFLMGGVAGGGSAPSAERAAPDESISDDAGQTLPEDGEAELEQQMGEEFYDVDLTGSTIPEGATFQRYDEFDIEGGVEGSDAIQADEVEEITLTGADSMDTEGMLDIETMGDEPVETQEVQDAPVDEAQAALTAEEVDRAIQALEQDLGQTPDEEIDPVQDELQDVQIAPQPAQTETMDQEEALAPPETSVTEPAEEVDQPAQETDAPAESATPEPAATEKAEAAPTEYLETPDRPDVKIPRQMVPAADLGTDAKTYQYKEGADTEGVTDRLKGVRKWDDMKAGRVVVHEREDGSRYVADGHQRLGLARKLESEGHAPINLDAIVLREADGFTVEDAKIMGAAKNMAEGSGTAWDAARIFRDSDADTIAESLPPNSSIVRDGRRLAALSDEATQAAINADIDPAYAGIAAQRFSDSTEQMAAVKSLVRYKPSTQGQAHALMGELAEAGAKVDQSDLFGGVDDSVMQARMRLIDRVQSRVRKDRAIMSGLVRNQKTIEGAARNVVDEEGTKAAKAESETIARFLQHISTNQDLNSHVTDQAKKVAEGSATVGEATRSILERARASLKRTEGKPAARQEEQQDLVGGQDDTALKVREERENKKEARRSAPPMDEGEGDLFSDKSKQQDVEDVAKKTASEPTKTKKKATRETVSKPMLSTDKINKKSVRALAKSLEQDLGLETLSLSYRPDANTIVVDYIIVPKDARKQGTGTQAMEAITKFSDQHDARVVLSPDVRGTAHGTTSRSRLVRFYKRFGFVENKGRNKDFTISEGMYREPKQKPMLATEDARAAIVERFGEKPLSDLEASGLFTIDESPADLPLEVQKRLLGEELDSQPSGLHEPATGQSWIFTRNIPSRDRVYGVFLHEVGAHYGMPQMLGKNGYKLMKKQIRELSATDDRVKMAIWRVPDNTPDEYFWDEVLAYLVQHEYTYQGKGKITDPLMKVLRQILARIKAFLHRKGFLHAKDMGVDDMVELVKGAAGRAAQTATPETQEAASMASGPADTFYSQMQRVLQNKLPNKGTPATIKQQIQNLAKKGQFKAEELEWSGVEQWLDSIQNQKERSKVVTKDEVLDFLRANRIRVEEVTKGGMDKEVTVSEARRMIERGDRIDLLDTKHNRYISYGDGELDFYMDDEKVRVISDERGKFADYQLPGGENYRELLLTLPKGYQVEVTMPKGRVVMDPTVHATKESAQSVVDEFSAKHPETKYRVVSATAKQGDYTGGHFDELNVLAHVRFNERTDADGNRVLFVEEVQSDWHQAGRKKGYGRTVRPDELTIRHRDDVSDEQTTEWEITGPGGLEQSIGRGIVASEQEARQFATAAFNQRGMGGVPDAPFKQTWPLLAMKRMIRFSAENGFDKIAWTTGEQQAARYDLSKQIDRISYHKQKDGNVVLQIFKDNKNITQPLGVPSAMPPEKVEDYVGKEVAEKIIDGGESGSLSGLDLKVGGEGMKAFYDKMLPSALNKYAKKWGAKVGTSQIETSATIGENADYRIEQSPQTEIFYVIDNSTDDVVIERETIEGAERFIRENRSEQKSVHALPITPQMREAVMDQGQPLFSKRGAATPEQKRERLRRMGLDFEDLPGDLEGSQTRPTTPEDTEPESVDTETARENVQKKMPKPMLAVEKPADRPSDQPVDPGFSDWRPPQSMMGTISDSFRSKEGIRQRLRSVRRKLQDKHIAWRDVQAQIEESGGRMTDFSDAYNRFTLIEGKIGDRFRKLYDNHVKPFINELVKSDVTMDQLNDYLYAKFAPQRNDRIARINLDSDKAKIRQHGGQYVLETKGQSPQVFATRREAQDAAVSMGLSKMPDGGSGMTNQESTEVLGAFSPEQTEQLESLAQQIYRMQKVKLDALVESGRITAEYRNELLTDDRYVPLKGFEESDAMVVDSAAVGRGFDQAQDAFKRAGGRKSRAADIVYTSIRDIEAGLINAEKNRVGQSVLKMVMDNPNENIWKVNPVKVERVFNQRTGQVEQRVVDSYKALARDPNVFVTWVKGVPYAIEFRDNPNGESSLARAVKNMGVDQIQWYVRGLAALNRWLSYANTALSPEFLASNPIRDIQTAMAKALGDYDAKTSRKVLTNLRRSIPAAIGALGESSLAKRVGAIDPVTQQYAQEWLAAGGKTDYFRTKTVDDMRRDLDAEFRSAEEGMKGMSSRAFRALYHTIENANAVLENGARLSMFITLREAGHSIHQAAAASKNLTVNFNRKGEAGALINSLYLFYNASLQGAHLTLRLMKNPKIQRLMVKAGIGMMVLAQYNILAGGDDDDGEPKYFKNIQDWERERNLIIMWPDGSGRYTKIPLPYGLNVPLNAATSIAHVANGQDPMKEAAWLLGSAWNSFSPVGEHGWNIVAPTVLDPFMDIALNRNFMDRNVMPEQNPFEKTPTPDSERSFPWTHESYKKVARFLNKWTAGNEQKPGYVDISPESIEHMVETYTGAAGGFLNRVITWQTNPDFEKWRIPFVRKFYGEETKYSNGGSYQDNKKHVFYLDKRIEHLREKSRENLESRELLEDFEKNNQEGLRLVGQLESTERRLKRLYKQRGQAKDRGEDERVKEIESRIREEQGRFNKSYNDTYLDRGIGEFFR